MQIALVDGVRCPATRGVEATCPQCGTPVIAKCGTLVIHHWAHVANECDAWWEPETAWHRDWKLLMPSGCVEVTRAGHRADIVRNDGTVVELQHSPISPDEIAARELAYTRMVWLFDGGSIPDDALDFRDHGTHHSFRWKHPRKHYGVCRMPVLIDFGPSAPRIFWLKRLHLERPPYGGWGYFLDRTCFTQWLMSGWQGGLKGLIGATMPTTGAVKTPDHVRLF